MKKEETYFEASNYLKGVAIISVLFFHAIEKGAYANTIIAVFFILSGYGIYYSLEKRFEKGMSFKKIYKFYLSRFFKIYILLGAGFFLYFYFQSKVYHWTAYTGLYITGHYWFISAIIHCYLISILLYLMIKKLSVKYYLITITLIIFILNVFYFIFYSTLKNLISEPIVYRFFFLSYILFFAYGMTIPYFLRKNSKILSKNELNLRLILFSFLILSIYAVLFISNDLILDNVIYIYNYQYTFIFLTMLFTTPVMIFLFLPYSKKNYLPFSRIISFYGIYSLSLYLFHTIYYDILQRNLVNFYGTSPYLEQKIEFY